MTVTEPQKLALIRCAVLIGRFGGCLSAFERDLVEAAVGRYRRSAERTTLTANEWRVVEEALGAMEAVRLDAEGADQDAAAGMRGAA